MHKKKRNTLLTELQLIYQHSSELFLLFDKNGEIINCNQAAKTELGYDENEIYKVSITRIFRKAIKKENDKLVICTAYQNERVETVAYRKNQTCFPVILRIILLPNASKFYGLCIAQNITVWKEAQQEIKNIKNELKVAEQIKNEFLATITHELRTPLNGIIGLIYNLLETSLKPNQLDTVNLLHSICLKMETIINNSIDYSRLVNNNIILEQREFDFHKFMDKVVSMNRESIEEKGLKLIVNVAEDIPNRVVGDEFRLTQILNNIISNAIKFTSVGQIAIEVAKIAQDSTHVELFFMVIDTGIGIAPEEMDRLFQSFTQVDGSFTRRYGGTGVGLSITKLLIEAMNGTITVESEKDQGSIFSFNIYLGLPKGNEETKVHENFYYNSDSNFLRESAGDFPVMRYISRILDEVIQFNQKSEWFSMYNSLEDNFVQQDATELLFDQIERLGICIEMESWKKAEDYASSIKNMLPKNKKEYSSLGLSLALAVRKAERERSIKILEKLIAMVKEGV